MMMGVAEAVDDDAVVDEARARRRGLRGGGRIIGGSASSVSS